MKKFLLKYLSLVCISIFLLEACTDSNNIETEIPLKPTEEVDKPRNYKIAVASDVHYFDLSLLKEDGKAFQDALKSDRKMLVESGEIIDNLIDQVIEKKPQLFLITGDLTKDGEKISHVNLIKKLDRVRSAGIKVFVIPGNHDINNPHALEFNGENTTPVDRVNPEEFAALYKNYGYNEAEWVEKGPNLCYLVEPIEGLWIIGIDACIYENNIQENYPRTGGELDAARMKWITDKAKEGKEAGKTVIAMMHHGVVEHFPGQATIAKDYLVQDYQNIGKEFALSNLNYVFTGHFHAQDIAVQEFGAQSIYDIETGSAVTYPCPYRIVDIDDNGMKINSHLINLNGNITQNKNLQDYAYEQLYNGMPSIINYLIDEAASQGLLEGLPVGSTLLKIIIKGKLNIITPLATELYTNHTKGDEKGSSSVYEDKKTGEQLKAYDWLQETLSSLDKGELIPIIDAAINDTNPADNDIEIPFKNTRLQSKY